MPANPGLPPFRAQVRWWVLALLLLITVINFLDRQALSVAAPVIRDQLRLSNEQYGTIVAAFQLGMLVGELPVGWMMDRIGPRVGFVVIVVYWSLANALHALARGVTSFSLFRFGLGSGECGNYSGGVKVVAQWFPPSERALAIGVFNSGSMLGALLAPPLIVPIVLTWGWQWAFVIPSALGLLWVVAWVRLYHAPERHPRLSPAEAHHIAAGAPSEPARPPRDGALLRVPQTWALMACRFLVGPVVQFYLYWMPEYLYRERGLSLAAIGALTWIPFLFGDIGSLLGGWLSGFLIRRGLSVPAARKLCLLIGATLCLMSAVVAISQTPGTAIAAISLVLLGHTFLSANMFAAITDVFPASAVGRVTALTGIAGGLSGIFFPWFTGVVVDASSYRPVLWLAAVMPMAGVLALMAGRGFRPARLAQD